MSLELRVHENGVYYIHWSEGRRSKRVSTGTKEMDGPNGAKQFLATWLACEQQVIVPGSTHTVGSLWEAYYTKHIVPNTNTRIAGDNWKNLRVVFKDLLVSQVSDAVDDYVAKRKKGVIGRPSVDATIRRELVALNACLHWCSDPKRKPKPLIDKSEVPAIELPPSSEPRDRWLRHDEVQRILDSARSTRVGKRLSRAERFLHLALETAARKTAIYELTWDRVDFETGIVHYAVPGQKKTKKRRVSVPISDSLMPVLQRAYAERLNPDRPDGHVLDVPGEMGVTISRIAKRAKVEDVSPHVLRHTAATHMARRGVSLWDIAGVLGNTMAIVERVYAKHCPASLRGAVNSISRGMLDAAE